MNPLSRGHLLTLADIFSDEHVLSSGVLQDVDHPAAGMVKMLASAVLIEGERPPIGRPPPGLGEHTEELQDWG